MRLTQPRIAPVQDADADEAQREQLAPFARRGRVLNVFRTLANHPEGMKAFMVYGNHVLGRGNTLPRREREIVILRIGYLSRAGYEWAQHGPSESLAA
jgi:alkylhydroperoxidase family enzyme